MIVTIDGPAGAGKSTVTRLLAGALGFAFLDTGAMYRVVTWAAMNEQLDLSDETALAGLARTLPVRLESDQVFVDQQNVSQEIRDPAVTRNVGMIADAIEVRKHLVDLQRKIAGTGDFVCEGRDQGTVAFPDAFCKIFLTASETDRAQRRVEQLKQAGVDAKIDDVIVEQRVRDEQDSNRPVGRLQCADDAIVVDSDGKTIGQVVEELLAIVRSKLP
jgi:cytidylate kinase